MGRHHQGVHGWFRVCPVPLLFRLAVVQSRASDGTPRAERRTGIRIAGRSGERREEETILDLPPKNLVLGIGCRKGISEKEIQSAVNEAKKILGFTEKEVIEIDSIDLKKEEEGLLSYAAKWKLPFYTFSAEELGKVKCVSSHSEFVRKVTGVDNVCERAAILAAGEDGRLLMPKQCMNRVTIAVAEKKVRIRI